MHPEFSRQMIIDHVASLRTEAQQVRRVQPDRRHLRNPLRRHAS